MLMDGIWDLILNSKKYIWHQLHTLNGMVVDLINPPHEWRFLSSGNPRKFIKKCFISKLYKGGTDPNTRLQNNNAISFFFLH